MKHIKLYEDIHTVQPYLNDYVVVKPNKKDFFVIGKIYGEADNYFFVKYTLPDGHVFNDIFFKDNEIIDFSSNKKDLESYISQNKYNL